MKLFSKISQTLKHIPRKTAITVLTVGLLAGVAVPKVWAEFYPDRPTFDYNKPCNPNDADKYDRCGSLTGPVLNSYINTPSYGDERAFLDARRTDQPASGSYKNVLTNVNQGSKEVVVRMYVHNDANPSTNASGLGVAVNTKVRVALPTAEGKSLRARGYISADNATPALVEDTVDFTASEAFSVEYVPGSAVLYDHDNFKNGTKVADTIVTTGAPVGSDALDGKLKGCFEHAAVVEIKVKIKTKSQPTTKVDFKKQVALPGASAWGEMVETKPGDTVKWLVSFKNNDTADLTKVNINDKLPPHLAVVPGSVRWVYRGDNNTDQSIQQNDTQFFTTGGIDFGTWKQNGGFFVQFQTTTKDDFEGCSVTVRNVAVNDTDQTDKVEDTADVKITKENCAPAEEEEEEDKDVKGVTTLPATGPGTLVGIFFSTTTAGALAYNFVYKRYYN